MPAFGDNFNISVNAKKCRSHAVDIEYEDDDEYDTRDTLHKTRPHARARTRS
jgi:hypothetical protein